MRVLEEYTNAAAGVGAAGFCWKKKSISAFSAADDLQLFMHLFVIFSGERCQSGQKCTALPGQDFPTLFPT